MDTTETRYAFCAPFECQFSNFSPEKHLRSGDLESQVSRNALLTVSEQADIDTHKPILECLESFTYLESRPCDHSRLL